MPYAAYRAVYAVTDSSVAAWVAAILQIPVGVVLYVRVFEHLRHRRKSQQEV